MGFNSGFKGLISRCVFPVSVCGQKEFDKSFSGKDEWNTIEINVLFSSRMVIASLVDTVTEQCFSLI